MPKIVDKYILRTFIPLFVMSFAVCWFIVVMQFLWRYIDELVGKGLSGFMLLKIIFYAALSFIPMSLPLGILLASLMTLGNLGERLELLALKASGIRLYRIIRPIMLLVVAMACGLFYFQNDLMIRAQVRMWTLVITAKYAAPEMEITPGVFYTGIPGYSLYAKSRDAGTGLMHRMMVYDMSRGYLNPRIIRADSGRLVMDKSKKFLVLKLYQGQSFENIQTQSYNTVSEPVPYMLPHFDYSETFIPFDANIKMQDEGELSSMYVGKNLHQLQVSIDSIRPILDSTRNSYARIVQSDLLTSHYGFSPYAYEDTTVFARQQERIATLVKETSGVKPEEAKASLTLTAQDSLQAIGSALDKAKRITEEAQIYTGTDDTEFYHYRTFHQEWHRKFTFPVSCIIFALIGASLGAIVRRGGIGMPIIISIFFFVVYFIIDSFGTNMLRSESIPIWLGMWLSNILLFPVGIFLAYKANQDSSALNIEAYVIFFRKLFGFRGVRKVEYQELIIEEAATRLVPSLWHKPSRIPMPSCAAPCSQDVSGRSGVMDLSSRHWQPSAKSSTLSPRACATRPHDSWSASSATCRSSPHASRPSSQRSHAGAVYLELSSPYLFRLGSSSREYAPTSRLTFARHAPCSRRSPKRSP